MMDIFSRKSMLLAIAASAMTFSACSHDDNLYEGEKPGASTDKTAENFMGMVGNIDPNQTWETVKSVEVNMPVNYGIGGTFKVVYYANNKIVGATTVADGQTLKGKLAVPSYTTEISISLSTDKGMGKVVKLPVGSTMAKAPMTRAAAPSGAIEYMADNAYTKVYPVDGNSDWGWAWGQKYVNGGRVVPYVWPHKFYYVDGAITGNVNPFTDRFVEKVKTVVPENELPAETREIIVQDYGLTVAEDGPVSVNYIFGQSSNQAAIGYFIYKDDPNTLENMDMSMDNLLNLLAENKFGRPVQDGDWGNDGEITANPTADKSDLKTCNKYVIIENMQNAGLQNGSQIQLTYYDENGNPSATFPKGTKIGFFIVPAAQADHNTGYINSRTAVYSFSKMNVEPHYSKSNYYAEGWNDQTYATSHAATFKLGDNIIVGFEDANNYNSADFDYNDFLFSVNGNFDFVPEVDDPDPDPEVQVFTYCYEDISTDGGDYDINDCVLKVTAPDADGNIDVTLAAVGATYQLKAWLGEQPLFGGKELHQVLGVATDVMVNTGLASASPVTTTINVGKDWNITDDGNFWLEVVTTGNNVTIPQFTAGGFTPGTVPYAFRIADDFDYPSERQAITAKYPLFKNWANDATQAIDWYKK